MPAAAWAKQAGWTVVWEGRRTRHLARVGARLLQGCRGCLTCRAALRQAGRTPQTFIGSGWWRWWLWWSDVWPAATGGAARGC